MRAQRAASLQNHRRRRWAPWLAAALLAGCGGGSGGGSSGPPQTIALAASVDTPAQVTLNWTAPADQTQFDLYRDGSAVFPTHISGHALTEFTLQPGTHHCWQLNAVQFPLGVVGTSNIACATTLPLAGWPATLIEGGAAQAVAVAIDDGGGARVALRAAGSIVLLQQDAGGAWTRSVVEAAAGDGGDVAIAVSVTRALHVSWYDAIRGVLKHATNAGGTWRTSEIGSGGLHHALVVDGAGGVHVAYGGDPVLGAPVMYATDATGSGWTTEFVDAGAVHRIALVIDSGGAPRLGWASGDGIACALLQAARGAGSWAPAPVAGVVACPGAVAIDRNGRLHAATQQRGSEFTLVHGSDASGAWRETRVDAFYWIPGSGVSLAVDAAGHPHVGYVDHSALLKYATDAGGGWSRAWLQPDARDAALALGADGRVRIAYVAGAGVSTALRWTQQP